MDRLRFQPSPQPYAEDLVHGDTECAESGQRRLALCDRLTQQSDQLWVVCARNVAKPDVSQLLAVAVEKARWIG